MNSSSREEQDLNSNVFMGLPSSQMASANTEMTLQGLFRSQIAEGKLSLPEQCTPNYPRTLLVC